MKTKYFLLLLLLPFMVKAQKPEQIKGIAVEAKPNEWYVMQAQAWKKAVDKNPKNANAWLNYYKACRYADFGISAFDWGKDKKELIGHILSEMEKKHSGNF